jgi:hypothetical protein
MNSKHNNENVALRAIVETSISSLGAALSPKILANRTIAFVRGVGDPNQTQAEEPSAAISGVYFACEFGHLELQHDHSNRGREEAPGYAIHRVELWPSVCGA